ncbi:MAG: hypothetical protein RL398_3357 [Planctomycetota bacterium]
MFPYRRCRAYDPLVTSAALAALGCADADDLAIDGIAARELADRFGTPLYAYSAAGLRRRAAAVRAALGQSVEVLYSIKANPSLAIAGLLREAGLGAEIASLGELHLARAAGFDVAALRFAGPGKTELEIATAVAAGVGTFHVESLDEIAVLAAAARAANRRVAVAVRVNLPQELAGARMRMGGKTSRFGIDEAQTPEALAAVTAAPHLDLIGLHVYAGTQCFDAAAFVAHATRFVAAAAAWERDCGVRLPELDLGGGFGVPLFAGDPEFDLAAAGRGLAELIAAHDRRDRRWFVELGRYLTAPFGVYLTRVVATKTSGGVRHVVLDGGLHQCAAAMGSGAVLKRPPLLVAADDLRGVAVPQTLGGPLCTPLDQFGTDLELPALAVGDVVAVLGAGAYGLSYSPTGFLSHATPAEVLVDGGRVRVIRARGDAEDVLRGQLP